MKYETHNKLLTLAEQAPSAAETLIEELYSLEREIAEFGETTCTGKEHWRDRDCETKSPKLYIIHAINQACPLHGKPNRNSRIRTYVGTKPQAITEAKTALARARILAKLQREEFQLNRRLNSAVYSLEQFHRFTKSKTTTKTPPPPGKVVTGASGLPGTAVPT